VNRKGGRVITRKGYVAVWQPDHCRASNGYVLEHVMVAESALGKPLPSGAQVHHLNGDKADNRGANLLVCPTNAYHQLLHRRERAAREAGNANAYRCRHCKAWDVPGTNGLVVYPVYAENTTRAEHRHCTAAYGQSRKQHRTAYQREYYQQNRARLLAYHRARRAAGIEVGR
jgi:hypothetical protein